MLSQVSAVRWQRGAVAALAVFALVLTATLAALTTTGAVADSPGKKAERKYGPTFAVATLNLRKGMRVPAMRHDINVLLKNTDTSVIGLQERLFNRRATKAALPKGWKLVMIAGGPTGSDDNPIAYDNRVWKLEVGWYRLLAARTWRRGTGQMAHDQYATAAILVHRATGYKIRAVSFHLPNKIHDFRAGGPRWSNRGAVLTMWRMAGSIRNMEAAAAEDQQFIVMCDCNVAADRDKTRLLVRGKISGPLNLKTTYEAGGPGYAIDYVMGERGHAYELTRTRMFRKMFTDHPGVVGHFVATKPLVPTDTETETATPTATAVVKPTATGSRQH